MKKLIYLLPFFFASCEDYTLTTAQKNAKQYTIEQINASIGLSIEDVDHIEVANTPDTVLATIPLMFEMRKLDEAKLAYIKEEIPYDSLLSCELDFACYVIIIETAAKYGASDSIKQTKQWSDCLRSSYPVTVHMKSGVTRDVSVVMDCDGITPTKFRHKLLEEIDEYNRKCVNL